MKAYAIFLVASVIVTPASQAQDLNTLERHLDHQQSTRVQDHQTRMRSGPERKRTVRHKDRLLPTCTERHVPSAAYARLQAQYRQIARTRASAMPIDGPDSNRPTGIGA